MATKRLMPGRVVQVYKRKGVKGKRFKFLYRPMQWGNEPVVNCGCVVGVCFASREEIHGPLEKQPPNSELEARAKAAGHNPFYINGIEDGFDGNAVFAPENEEYVRGHADGRKTWELLEKHGLTC